jgi:hypothetical protein
VIKQKSKESPSSSPRKSLKAGDANLKENGAGEPQTTAGGEEKKTKKSKKGAKEAANGGV